ncbi:MAG: glycosyltransferase [Desulfarculaceae bacterium]|nr:glycosyltransferase [Desulfarculaceae bacterium]
MAHSGEVRVIPNSGRNLGTGGGEQSPRVLALSDQYPNLLRPGWAAFNRQQLAALAELCPLALVAPVPWPLVVRAGRLSLPSQDKPFTVDWPVFWYLPRLLRRRHGRAFLRSAWPCLRKRARDLGPNVFLATWLFPAGWAGLGAARRLGLPLVIKLHGSDLMLLKEDPARLPYLREALSGASEVVAVSPALAQEASALGAKRVSVVPNGLNRELFTPADQRAAREELGLPKTDKLLVYVGRLHPIKGPDLAVQALTRLPQVRLVMVGGGAEEPRLRDLAAQLKVAPQIIWAGPQEHRKVPRYLAAADALVLPSRSEGDPNAVLEALGCGRPVVAARVGGVPEVVAEGRTGAMFPPGDPGAMAEAATRVLERDWDADTLAQAVAGRSWRDSAAQLYQVLARAAGEAAA